MTNRRTSVYDLHNPTRERSTGETPAQRSLRRAG
nr:MAG TPA: hypothetical protein [Caudoviricetes sp.]